MVDLFLRRSKFLIGTCLLITYALAIFLDLPTPAGNRYRQNLPDWVLVEWGAKPMPSAQIAPHWWYKVQGLRGWSVNPEGWAWANVGVASISHWIILLGLGVSGAMVLVWMERTDERNPRLVRIAAPVGLVLFLYTFQILTLQMKSANAEQLLLDRITDKYVTGYFNSAFQFDQLQDYFANYGATLNNPAYCSHCKTHPPGPVLFYWSFHHLVESLPQALKDQTAKALQVDKLLNPSGLRPDGLIVAWLGANTILLAAATIVIPLYGLARRLGARNLEVPLAALGAVIPGIILMNPQFDQIYAVVTAWLLYMGFRGLEASGKNFRWGVAAGGVFAFSLFWSVALAVLAAPLLLLIPIALVSKLAPHYSDRDRETYKLSPFAAGKWLLGFGLGTALPWWLLIVFGKFPLLSLVGAIQRDHIHGITAVRPYEPWLIFNLVDFVQFLGVPLALFTLYLLIQRQQEQVALEPAHQAIRYNPIRRAHGWFMEYANPFALLFWAVILVLDISGTTRGEVGRLWIFLMPLALLAVYSAAGRGRISKVQVHWLLAAQFMVITFIGGNWLTP